MSDAVTALNGAVFTGYVTVREAPLQGMISLRGDLAAPNFRNAATGVTGCGMPGPRGITQAHGRALAWMSPDEMLLLLAYDKVQTALGDIDLALAGAHALALDVSDARAMFIIEGPAGDEVLAKLCPVDFPCLPEGELRRTRAAQVPVALWRSAPKQISLICFRSVAHYVFDILTSAATPKRDVGFFNG